MKKIFKIIGIILLPFILIGGILAFSIITGRFDKGAEFHSGGTGSMKDYGFNNENDSDFKVYSLIDKCEIGDNCAFVCLTNKCVNGSDDKFIKHLVKKEGDCYWFEGNKEKWEQNGVMVESWDSRKYGWLCGDELKIQGVVK